MDIKTKKKVDNYIVDLLEFLDGRGIIFTDEDLVRQALRERDYSRLEANITGKSDKYIIVK